MLRFFLYTLFLTQVLAQNENSTSPTTTNNTTIDSNENSTTTRPLNRTLTTTVTTTNVTIHPNGTTTETIIKTVTTLNPTKSGVRKEKKIYKFTTTTLTENATAEKTKKKYDSVATAAALSMANNLYCEPSLCRIYNGSAMLQAPHIGCKNNGTFANTCGKQPYLLYMNERRRNLILDVHNLARSRIASGQLLGFQPATHMPLLKWDNELEFLATLHVKRCKFEHDECRNTQKYRFSGQNIGDYGSTRDFRSHSSRIKFLIVAWFQEYQYANQSLIDNFQRLPKTEKPIGHFTQMVADSAHRVGCAAVHYRDVDNKFLLTCNYDFGNILNEPIYRSGPSASKCVYDTSEKYPGLCDWKDTDYDYDSEESIENDSLIDNNIFF